MLNNDKDSKEDAYIYWEGKNKRGHVYYGTYDIILKAKSNCFRYSLDRLFCIEIAKLRLSQSIDKSSNAN